MKTASITVRVLPEVAERLEKLARATSRSRSHLAAMAIEEYLALEEWQVEAIQKGIQAADRNEGQDLEQVRARWENRGEDPAH